MGSISTIPGQTKDDDLEMSSSPTMSVPPSFALRNPTSPIRFATTIKAFGLMGSPSSSSSPSSSRDTFHPNGMVDISPPTAGTVSTRRLRRPSMLSLAQTATFASEGSRNEEVTATAPGSGPPVVQDLSSSKYPFTHQPAPRWGPAAFLMQEAIRRPSSAPPPLIEGLTTSTPPTQSEGIEAEGSGSQSPMDLEGEPLRWMPNHLQSSSRRKGKARMEDARTRRTSPNHPNSFHAPPFTGRPLPAPLLATLISESSPLEHEMRSEARLQRLLLSHPHALPLTPRAPRSSRGRFPEMVGGDDDDEDDPSMRRRSSWARISWMNRASSSDSDSDEMTMPDADPPEPEPEPEPVNSAFAAGMDMDRPTSSSSSSMGMELSGKSTPGQSRSNSGSIVQAQAQPTPPMRDGPWGKGNMRLSFGSAGFGMVPSPGSGLGLPNAFGGLGMSGVGTPLGSPTIERVELAGSPSAGSVSSPGLMQYRESQGGSVSVRPGKRKAQAEDRFDPYKRPRGTSPSLSTTLPAYPLSPSRPTTSIPIPPSPLYPSSLSTSMPTRHTKSHPYTRPMTSRSRAASPSTACGAGGRGSFSLGQALIPGAQALGGLGLLSLGNVGGGGGGVGKLKEEEAVDMSREDSGGSREAMEED